MNMCRNLLVYSVFFGCVALCSTPSSGQEVDYDDITSNALLSDPDWINTANASAIDLTGDGFKDLLVSQYSSSTNPEYNTMYWEMDEINFITKDPMFVIKADGFETGFVPDINTNGFLFADFNNDGEMDVYAPHHNGGLLYLNSAGVLDEVTSESVGLAGVHSIGAAWGDFNGDSYIDLIVLGGEDPVLGSGVSNAQYLYINVSDAGATGGRKFQKVTGFPSTNNIGSALVADFDSDTDVDILLVQSAVTTPSHNDARYYENIGNYHLSPLNWFLDQSDAKFDLLGDCWDRFNCAAAVVDFDNDGVLDVVFSNASNYGWLENDGAGALTAGVVKIFGVTAGDIGIMDVDLDGRVDFIRGRNSDTQVSNVFRNVYTAEHNYDFVDYTNSVGLGDLRSTKGICLSDMNKNGFTEVFYSVNNAGGAGKVLHRAAPKPGKTQNNWVGVKLTSSASGIDNYACIGATVHVEAGLLHHAKVVDGGMGRASQGDHDMVFGLGTYVNDVALEAFFPSGAHIQLSGLAVDQYHNIDLQDFELTSNSESFERIFNADGTEDWVFTWSSTSFSDNYKDCVSINVTKGPGIVYDDQPTPSSNFDVFLGASMYKNTGGLWEHQVVMHNVVCELKRTFNYTVKSGLGPYTGEGATKSVSGAYCISQ